MSTLKFSSWQDLNGDTIYDALTNKFNEVTALYQSTTSIPNATQTPLSYTTAAQILQDVSGWHDPAVNPTRITVDKRGLYLVGSYCQIQYTGALASFSCNVRRNGSYIPNDGNVIGSYFPTPTSTTIIDANAGDYFEATIYQDSGGTVNPWAGRNGFYVMLLRTL